MKYSNGLITRDRIIEVCRELFYESGLTQTTYVDICTAADVRPGTLSHHFHGKANIAAAIYYKASRALDLDIIEAFPDEDRRQQLLLFIYAQTYTMYNDDRFSRFHIEFLVEDMRVGTYVMYSMNAHGGDTNNPSKSSLDDDSEFAMFRASAYRGAQAALCLHFNERKHGMSHEEGFRNWAIIFLRLQGAQSEEIEQRIERIYSQKDTFLVTSEGLKVHLRLK